MKHILILGAGFSGLHAYLGLRKRLKKSNDVRITIINENNYFLFSPMLHEVTFGSVDPSHIVHPLRRFLKHKNDRFIQDSVVQVILEEKIVLTKKARTFSYDYLILSLGSHASFFDVPGAKSYTYTLKTLSDAIILRNAIIGEFEKYQPGQKIIFTIVGGGLTGVEIAAQLATLVNNTIKKLYTHIKSTDITISLIHDTPRLLPTLPGIMGKKAIKELSRMGVQVQLSTTVKEVKENILLLSQDKIYSFTLCIWSAGIAPNTKSVMTDYYLDEIGYAPILPTLLVEGLSTVFALGDTARFSSTTEKILPRTAQVAIQQGQHAAKNIIRLMKNKKPTPFKYIHKGDIIPLGDWYALARIGRWTFSGRLAWFLRRTIFLFNLYSLSKQIKVVVDWTVGIFTPRDTTRIK